MGEVFWKCTIGHFHAFSTSNEYEIQMALLIFFVMVSV